MKLKVLTLLAVWPATAFAAPVVTEPHSLPASMAQPQVSEPVRQQLEAQRAQQAMRARQRPALQPQNSQDAPK